MKYEEIMERFNRDRLVDWAVESWEIAMFFPERLDPKKYNWERSSPTVWNECPEMLEPSLIYWEALDESVLSNLWVMQTLGPKHFLLEV